MAVEINPNQIEGVNLPYTKITSFSGTKNKVAISLGYCASSENQPLSVSSLSLSPQDEALLADALMSTTYQFLVNKNYLPNTEI